MGGRLAAIQQRPVRAGGKHGSRRTARDLVRSFRYAMGVASSTSPIIPETAAPPKPTFVAVPPLGVPSRLLGLPLAARHHFPGRPSPLATIPPSVTQYPYLSIGFA